MPASRRSAVFFIAAICAAQTAIQLGAFTFPALLPAFFDDWDITHTEAGWLSGILFGAYALSVPVILPLTDRMSPRKIYLLAAALTVLSHLGMTLVAQGFWTGMIFRILAGIGWGGTYMVGLKLLTDLIPDHRHARAVTFHAASIGVGGALSFVVAGAVGTVAGWQGAFLFAAGGAAAAYAIVAVLVPEPDLRPQSGDRHFDFRPVLRNRSAMAYALGYCVHTWEMFTMRSWVVVFLVFAVAENAGRDGEPNFLLPTVAATMMEMIGTVTSVFGNEMASRLGRRRWVFGVMLVSMACAALVGFSAGLGYGVAVAACFVYYAFIYADSSALTAGTVGSADPARRGATLGVHATLGYGGGFVGPLVFGTLMDALGGETLLNWGLCFAHVAVIMLVGPLALAILRPRNLPGDRPG